MTRKEIEQYLTLPILNLCLAALSQKDGDLAAAKAALIDAVVKIGSAK